jgi:hypothetical protein
VEIVTFPTREKFYPNGRRMENSREIIICHPEDYNYHYFLREYDNDLLGLMFILTVQTFNPEEYGFIPAENGVLSAVIYCRL